MSGIRTCLDALLDIHQKWPLIGARAIRQIQELANRWKVVWTLPIALAGPLSMDTVQATSGQETSVFPGGSGNPTLLPPSSSSLTPPTEETWTSRLSDSNFEYLDDLGGGDDFWNMDGSQWDALIAEDAMNHS